MKGSGLDVKLCDSELKERGLNLNAELSVESSCGEECLLRAPCDYEPLKAVECREILSVKKGSSHGVLFLFRLRAQP